MTAPLDLAERAARAAGALLRERFDAPARGVGSKSGSTDLVSDADRDAEALILSMIHDERPGDAVLGEETGSRSGSSGLRWIVDPLDGTVNFLHAIPQWCVSIACEDDRGGVAGVVYDAMRDECFAAVRGEGAALNGRPIAASAKTSIERALIATGFGYDPKERERWGGVVAQVLPRVADVRRGGSAALDLAWAACGRVDAYAEVPCREWDRAAGLVIAREAGCEAAMLDAIGDGGDGVLCAPPALFAPLASMLGDAGIAVRSPA